MASSIVFAIMAFYYLRAVFEWPPEWTHAPALLLEGAALLVLLRFVPFCY
jgi:hypothetical protein